MQCYKEQHMLVCITMYSPAALVDNQPIMPCYENLRVGLLTDYAVDLQFPSRGLQEAGIHGHFFVNGGNLSLLSGTGKSLKQSVTQDFAQSWRWSAVRCLHTCSLLAAFVANASPEM